VGRLYVTELSPGRRHSAAPVERIGRALMGQPFMPHQREVAQLSTERLSTGRRAYTTIIVSLPRQAGKTSVRAPLAIHRCLTQPAARCWLTAQTRQDARDLLVDDVGPKFTGSPQLAPLGKLRRSQGSEGLYFARGSFWRVFAPNSNERGSNSIHGKANELVDVDEGFALDPITGAAIEQAVVPSFSTTGGQLSIVSTAGFASSTWFRGYVDLGREAVAAGERAGIALVEYGLTEEQAAAARAGLELERGSPGWLAALELIAREHPAYGVTLVPSVIEQYARLPRVTTDDVLRAFGNVWQLLKLSAFPAGSWAACGAEQPPQPAHVGIGFDVTPDGSRGAVAAAWRDVHGRPWVELLTEGSTSSSELPAILLELSRRRRAPLGYDTAGPSTLAVADKIARARPGLQLHGMTMREYATACAVLYQAVVGHQLRHSRQPGLDQAVDAAAQRPALDGGFLWDRRTATGSIAPLVAATAALRVYDQSPAPRNLVPAAAPSS
jgi:hypothetical protein